jgi:hypothetical protein
MGTEYAIRFEHAGPESVNVVLRRLRMAQATSQGFELRATQTDGMPDAFIRIEPNGLYYCDNGGAGKEFLGVLIARMVSEFGPVTVADWE